MKKMLKGNTVKRVFAVLLAFSLCAGYLLIPAAADEDDGGVVVVTETTTTTSGGVTHTETTTTETRKTEETKGGATGADGNTSEPTKTSDTTVTKTEGTETTKDVTDTQGSKTVYESQEVSGEETTTVTQETKTEHTETTESSSDDVSYTENEKESTESTTPTETISSTESTEPVSLDAPQSPNVTLEMNASNGKTDSEQVSAAGSAAQKYNLNNVTGETTVRDTGEGTEKTESGRTTVVQKPIYMDDANADEPIIIGYQIVTTNVKVKEDTQTGTATSGTANEPVTSEGKPVTKDTTPDDNTRYEMPKKPEGGVIKNSDGTTVTTTVEEIMEGDEVVGYKTTSVTTDSHGKELNRSSESIYRTEITTKSETTSVTTTTTTTTPLTNQRTTTTVTTTIVDTEGHVLVPALGDDGNWYWVYTGTLGNVTAGNGNGAINMDSLKPNMTGLNVDTSNDLYNRVGETVNNGYGDWPLIWTGKYGLESAIRVLAKNSNGNVVDTWQPHLFILSDKTNPNKEFYAYCADFEVSALGGYRYGMENLEDATYYNNNDDKNAAQHIRYIALNGYWGTNGAVGTPEYTGSLAAVKALMERSGQFDESEINGLTPGQAITATQAAIWYYGNSNKNPNSGIDKTKGVVGRYFNGKTFGDVPDAKAETVNKLFKLLISGTQEATAGTTIINENNFATAANLEIKEKVSNATTLNGSEPQTTQPDKDKYNTNLSFSLLLEPSQGDELTVTVLDSDNKVLKKVALCGNDSESKWHKWLYRDANQMYTIEDVEIAEGTTITLNLSGTQNLQPGVYLYTSEVRPDEVPEKRTSQTFVGVANGTRNVNLNVNLEFSVQDPQLAVKTSEQKTKSTTTDKKVYDGTGTRTEVTESKHITVTQTVTQSTRRTWNSSWARRYPGNNGGGGEETGGNRRLGVRRLLNLDETKKNELTIPDEEVPLAKAPVTGDISTLWFVLGCLSLAGMILLNRKRKEVQ